jgi:prolyl oligopeptidase
VISAANSTYGNELYIKDLTKQDSPISTIVDNFNSDSVIDSEGTKLYIETDLNAPNKRNGGCK